jgi:nucleoside phosphorylase
MPITTTPDSYPLAILVPLEKEYQVLREVFGEPTKTVEAGGREYLVFSIPLGDREIPVLCCVIGVAGVSAARGATDNLLRDFTVPVLVLAGIAGGLHDDVRIGDVVVATQVDHYEDDAKVAATGVKLAGRVWHAPWRLTDFIRRLQYRDHHLDDWRSRVTSRHPKLTGWQQVSRETPQVHVRPIASGSTVVAQKEFREMLLRRNRKTAAVEMEAAGVAAAANERRHPVELLVVRGISDLADPNKDAGDDDKWQHYAMLSVFEFVAALCRGPGLSPSNDPDLAREIDDALSELDEIATEYELLHGTRNRNGTMSEGRARSYYLRKQLKRARFRARRLPPTAYDVSSHLESASEGERVVAIAIAQAADNPVFFCGAMLKALVHAESNFEQTEVLRFFESVADELDADQRRDLSSALEFIKAQEVPAPPYPLGGDRRLLIRVIERWMRGATA